MEGSDAEQSEDEEIKTIDIKAKRQKKDMESEEDEEMAPLDDSVEEDEDDKVKLGQSSDEEVADYDDEED